MASGLPIFRRTLVLALAGFALALAILWLAAGARSPAVLPGLVFRFEAHDASGTRQVVCDFCGHRFADGETSLHTQWLDFGWPLTRWLGRVAVVFRRASVQPLPPLRSGEPSFLCAATRERTVDYDTVVVLAPGDRVQLEGTDIWIRLESIGAHAPKRR